MNVTEKLHSALCRVQHKPERYPENLVERLERALEHRKKRGARLWLWRHKLQSHEDRLFR